MIETRDLSKTFRDRRRGEVRAVDGLTFRAVPGQVYGLLGANGAGKTTAMRMLATLLAPTRGRATVDGFDSVASPAQVRSRVGFLAAGAPLYGRLTAREMIAYFGRLNGLDGGALDARISILTAELGLHEFIDRRCDSLSTGMRQKASIARAIVHDPPVMILDEPTLGLDVMTARAVVRFVRDCRARGKTVVYSTHVMSEAEKLCDVIGIFHAGRLCAEGTLEQLRDESGERDLEEIFVRKVGAVGGEGTEEAEGAEETS